MKFLHATLLFLSLILSINAFADEKSEAEATKLLDIMGMDAILDSAIQTAFEAQAKQKPEMAIYRDVFTAFFKKYMSYEALKPDLVALYAAEFNASELKEIRKFYMSDVGKKTLEKMPSLYAKGAELGRNKVKDNLVELQQMIRDESERIQQLQKDAKQP